MRMKFLLACALVVVAGALLASCEVGSHARPTSSAAVSATTRASTPLTGAASARAVVRLNGKVVAHIDGGQLSQRRPLTAVLPDEARSPESWRVLRAMGHDGSHMQVTHPQLRVADSRVEFYAGDGATVGLGVFRRDHPSLRAGARARLNTPSTFVNNVAEVQVWTIDPPKAANKKTRSVVLQVGKGAEPIMLTRKVLARVPVLEETKHNRKRASAKSDANRKRAKRRRRGTRGRRRWRLVDVLAPHCTLERLASVTVSGTAEPVTLSAKALQSNDVTLRLTRRKGFLLEWQTEAEGRQRLSDVNEIMLHLKLQSTSSPAPR
jgi:hypothetical protein